MAHLDIESRGWLQSIPKAVYSSAEGMLSVSQVPRLIRRQEKQPFFAKASKMTLNLYGLR